MFEFLPLNLSVSPNIVHFFVHFHYACFGREAYCYWKGLKLWKNCIHQKQVWKWLVRYASPQPRPLEPLPPALITMFPTTTVSHQPVWLQYDVRQILSQLFWNISAYCTCTSTVWTLHFKNKSSVSKGGGFDPRTPPWVRYCIAGLRLVEKL